MLAGVVPQERHVRDPTHSTTRATALFENAASNLRMQLVCIRIADSTVRCTVDLLNLVAAKVSLEECLS